jgi:signal transduction histidine kinase/ActR/RegA family two-component response regulator
MNLLQPAGQYHHVIDEATFREVVQTRRPVVGNIFNEPITGHHVFPVRVPVTRGGELRYVLTALVRPESIGELLSPQRLPDDWVGVVLDAHENIVARTIGEGLVGRPASDSQRGALASSDEGWFQGSTIEGWPVYTPYNRSAFSGWTVAIGIPRAAIDASMRRSLGIVTGVLLGLVAMGFVLARLLSVRSTRSLEDLAHRARALGEAEAPEVPAAPRSSPWPDIAEIRELRGAFGRAAELIRSRSSERDRVEASLRLAEAELRASDQRKDQFLAMLGHELRNPLGVISTSIHLLNDSPDADESAQLRSMIERQVTHMAKLLDDLLDVSRIAEGRVQMDSKPCDLTEIVRHTVEDHRRPIETSGLSLELSLPDAPLWMLGDEVRLSQALGNVLQNSVKYTEPGGTVSVHLCREGEAERARLIVSDSGAGMEPEILATAFEPFSQADRTLDRSRGGLGLGLALVKGLIELHGGSVCARSDGPGRGSELEIELPLEPIVEATDSDDDAAAGTVSHAPLRILLIEDNESYAHSLQLYLQRFGHRVEVARSGSEGIELARRFLPQAVLCDIGLPGVDGYQVARALRGMDDLASARILAISGYGQKSDRQRAMQAGFDEHLTKPVDLDRLLELLRSRPAARD